MLWTDQAKQKTEKALLLVGFLSLMVATLLAHQTPATTYEVSIYTATPLVFWIGVAVSMAVAIGVAFRATDFVQLLALVLAGVTTTVVAALPVIRSYFYYGRGDALTHLGWAREIETGALNPVDLLYPGVHTIAVSVSELTGAPIRRAILLTVVVFVCIYLLFIPLCSWIIDPESRTATFATLSACLLLPINGVSLFMQAHPASQAVLLFPFVFYIAIKYITSYGENSIRFLPSSFGMLLALASLAILLVHPQQTANVLVVYGAIVGVQWLYSIFRLDHSAVSQYRSLLGQTSFLTVLFILWMATHQRASGSASYLIRKLISGSSPSSDIKQHAGGLAQIGGEIETMFIKLFLISFIFCLIAGLTLLTGVAGRLRTLRANHFSKVTIIGLVPLFGLFGVYLVTSAGGFHFRQLGFIMVLMTIFGAIGFSHLITGLELRIPIPTAVVSVVAVLFAGMLVLSGLTLFHSPFVYQASGDVTEGEMTGYARAFEHRGDITFIGLRSPGTRFADAIYGVREENPRRFLGGSLYGDTPLTGKNFTAANIYNYYNSSRYLIVTDAARQRELKVYNSLRFTQKGFRSLNSQPGVARIQSGGGTRVYLINKTGEEQSRAP